MKQVKYCLILLLGLVSCKSSQEMPVSNSDYNDHIIPEPVKDTTDYATEGYIFNPSFEGIATAGSVNVDGEFSALPNHWTDCNSRFHRTTPPDVHGIDTDFSNVKNHPSDGKTFIGMVYRGDHTYESMSQTLNKLLAQGKCYNFAIDLAHSKTLNSLTQQSRGERITFDNPIQLSIYASEELCARTHLIYKSPFIDHEEWKTYTHTFRADINFTTIWIESYHKFDLEKVIHGNILIDNMQDFIEVDCLED